MLTLIEGGFSSGITEEINDRILASIARGRKSFLIVPEQQTLIAEAALARLLPESAPLFFEVTNFTRLANTVFRSLGGLTAEYCTKTQKLLLVWRALTELAPTLKSADIRGEVSVGLAERFLSAISEIQSAGLSADDLAELSDTDEIQANGRLHSKISDLSAVMSTYKDLLSKKFADTDDDVGLMLTKLKNSPDFFSDTDFFVDGFTSFTSAQYKLLAYLAKIGELCITLTIPKARRDAFEFSEIVGCERRLIAAADALGVEKRLGKRDGHIGKKHELLYEITDNIWRFNAKIDNNYLQNPDVVRIFSCKTPFEMCDFLCADIKRRVMSGERYSDFAVIAREASTYTGILDTSFAKYKIPAFTSTKKEIDSLAAIKLIYSAYSVVSSRFERENVIAFAKCGFTGIPREEIDEFESYVNKWQINRARFTDTAEWHMSPSGFDERGRDEAEERLARINKTRERLIKPLIKLSENAAAARTVREHAEVLTDFLCEVDLESQLARRAQKMLEAKRLSEADELSRLWDIICGALDALVAAISDAAATPSSFLTQLKIVFSSSELGKIPARVDEVTVGGADMLRLYGRKHVYLIGVNEGEFPAPGHSPSYFAESERQIMERLGVSTSDGVSISEARELFCFSRAMSYAEETLTLLFSERNSSLKAVAHAEAIDRLEAMSDGKISPMPTTALPPCDKIFTESSASQYLGELSEHEYGELKAALIEIGREREVRIAESSVSNSSLALTEELTGEIFGDKLRLTQSRIDSYVSCPLNYFCKYNLLLKSDEIADFNAASIGSFIHAILENFFGELKRRGNSVSALSKEERERMTAAAARKYLAEINEEISEGGKRMEARIKRLCRIALPIVDGLCDEFSDCRFAPAFFELPITRKDDGLPDPPAISVSDGSEVDIFGIIDRVDTLKLGRDVYVRVVDYKTGHKVFSPENLENGENLQMFLYLKAITDSKSPSFREALGVEDGGEIIPAGVIYVNTSLLDVKVDDYSDEGAEKEIKALQKRQGMLLDDEEIIRSMNTSYLPITFKRGEIDEKSKALLYSRDGWSDIMKTVEGAISDVALRIRSGEISATPKKNGTRGMNCDWCEFKPLCRKHSFS